MWHLLLILLMGGALVMKCVISYCQGNTVFAVHHTVKTRRSASWHAVRVARLIKQDWPIRISAQDNFMLLFKHLSLKYNLKEELSLYALLCVP